MTEITTDTDVLTKLLTTEGMDILDIGSGDGNLVRFLTKQGATVTGLECGAAQLEAAKSYAFVGEETYVEGVAQQLPFADNSFDVSIFFNSLHHVPIEYMPVAIAEAERVTRPKGMIYMAEPIAAGSGYEFSAPIDDEATVRAMAYDCVQNAIADGLTPVCEVFYDTVYHYRDFEAFKEEMIRIDPTRLVPFETMETDLQIAFNRFGVLDERGVRFDQPMRVNLLTTHRI